MKKTYTCVIDVPAREWVDRTTREVTKRRPAFQATIEVEVDVSGIAAKLGSKAAVAASGKSRIGNGLVRTRTRTKPPAAVQIASSNSRS